MPRTKKPFGQAVDPRNGQRALSVAGSSPGGVGRFDPPAGLTDAAVDAWEGFWEDRPALLLTPSARPVLLRWIDALNRYVRFTALADKSALIKGSTGQLRTNPLYGIAEQALRTAEACERQLGIGSLNAAALGLAAIAERRSLIDLNARYQEEDHGAADDPRLTLVGPA